MPNVYSPVRQGFAQSAYVDQMATALAGSLAFASDSNLVDAFLVGDVGENGLEAGFAVVKTPAASVQRVGINEHAVTLPASTATADQIIGVTVRNQQMHSNASGHACWFAQDMCNVARVGRSGARVWVCLAEGEAPAVDTPASVIVSGKDAGKFAASGGVAVPGMMFRSAAKDGIALVELV